MTDTAAVCKVCGCPESFDVHGEREVGGRHDFVPRDSTEATFDLRALRAKWSATLSGDEFEERLSDSHADIECCFDEIEEQQREIERLREMLWETRHCGPCGNAYKYNRADDPKGVAAHARHLIDSPACEIPF